MQRTSRLCDSKHNLHELVVSKLLNGVFLRLNLPGAAAVKSKVATKTVTNRAAINDFIFKSVRINFLLEY